MLCHDYDGCFGGDYHNVYDDEWDCEVWSVMMVIGDVENVELL